MQLQKNILLYHDKELNNLMGFKTILFLHTYKYIDYADRTIQLTNE
jgi:hypothetical protein